MVYVSIHNDTFPPAQLTRVTHLPHSGDTTAKSQKTVHFAYSSAPEVWLTFRISVSVPGTMANSGKGRLGKFHPKCSSGVKLSEDRKVARGSIYTSFVFSNDPIPIGLQFSVKILRKGSRYVSPLSASSRPPPSAAPYTFGGAVRVVHCCLFFVYCDGVEGA